MNRLYCTARELINDLELDGYKDEAGLVRTIEAASQYIERHIGQFTPSRETLKFNGDGKQELLTPPLLNVYSVTNDGSVLSASDYILTPNGRHWTNGPYSSLVIADDGSAGSWSSEQEGVEIDGDWGLLDETVSTGLTVTFSDGSGTSLSVGNGGLLSAGMVLLVESEQLVVEASGAATASGATLASWLEEGTEEIAVSDGSLIQAGEVIKLDFEQARVLDVSGNLVLAERGWGGTKRATHSTGRAVHVYRSFAVRRGVNGTTAAAHSSKDVYQYVAPADINYLCRQIAALMIKKKQTGYVGRAGNDELGTGFFVNEFPKNQIEAVKRNYFWGGR